MANHPSAVKRNRQRIVRTVRNRAAKSNLRSVLKEARVAAAAGDQTEAAAKAALAKKALARAASKGVIHANNAARRTARIDRALGKIAA
jgi:small subunit ribosomal protein S20